MGFFKYDDQFILTNKTTLRTRFLNDKKFRMENYEIILLSSNAEALGLDNEFYNQVFVEACDLIDRYESRSHKEVLSDQLVAVYKKDIDSKLTDKSIKKLVDTLIKNELCMYLLESMSAEEIAKYLEHGKSQGNNIEKIKNCLEKSLKTEHERATLIIFEESADRRGQLRFVLKRYKKINNKLNDAVNIYQKSRKDTETQNGYN